jgi:hypothetical protein
MADSPDYLPLAEQPADDQAGLTRRDPAGRLLGSHGLSVVCTHHELVIDGRRRWAAAAWARLHGISGAAQPVAQATRVGAAAWRAYLWPGTTPAGGCPPGAPPTSTGAERRPMATRIDLAQLQELLDGGDQLVEVLPAAEYADEQAQLHHLAGFKVFYR